MLRLCFCCATYEYDDIIRHEILQFYTFMLHIRYVIFNAFRAMFVVLLHSYKNTI